MDIKYKKDKDGNLIEQTTTERVYTKDDLQMQSQIIQSQQTQLAAEAARLDILVTEFDKV